MEPDSGSSGRSSGYWLASPERRIRALLMMAAVVLAVLGVGQARLGLKMDAGSFDRMRGRDIVYLPPHEVLRAMSLGHTSLFADLLFMRVTHYFVSHLQTDRIYDWFDTYMDAVLALDPDNPRFYEWASQVVKFGQMLDNDAVRRSIGYSQRGIERFPDHWRFYQDIGFNYLAEWQTDDPEERAALREKALRYYSVAAAIPGSQIDPNTLAVLYLDRNEVEMALLHAYFRYWEASETEREQLRLRIARYGSAAVSSHLERSEREWKASFPYLPFGLFELVGAPSRPRLPRSWAEPPEWSGHTPEGS